MKAVLTALLFLPLISFAAADSEVQSHPLTGVVIDVVAERQALLVKHEEVPGVMRAMTMLLKVEPAVVEQVKKGDAIKGMLSRRADGWWLHGVDVVAPAQPAAIP